MSDTTTAAASLPEESQPAKPSLGLGKLGSNIGVMLVSQVSTTLLTLAIMMVLTRGLGPTGNGIQYSALLVPTVIAQLFNLGISPANSYYLGSGQVTPKVALKVTFWLSVALSALGISLAIPFIYFFSSTVFPGVNQTYLWWMVAVAPIGLMQVSLSSIFLGLQIFKPFSITTILVPAVTFVTALVLVIVLHWGVVGSLTAYVTGQVTSLTVTLLFLKPVAFSNEPPAPLAPYALKCLSYGYKAHLSNILGFLNYRIDSMIVLAYLGTAVVGIYSVSVRIGETLWIIAFAACGVLLPRLSELNKDPEAQQRLTPLIGRWVLLTTLAASIVCAIVSYPLIPILFGKRFMGAYPILLWLLPGVILLSVSRVLANDIAARGKIIINLYLGIVLLVINVAANLMLIPPFGASGAAGASTIGYLADTSIRLYIYTRMSGNKWYAPLIPQRHDWELLRKGSKIVQGRLRSKKIADPVPEIPIG